VSKIPLPFAVPDISALARALRRQLDGLERLPSHLEMLNLLARSAGFKNFQHFHAEAQAGPPTPGVAAESAPDSAASDAAQAGAEPQAADVAAQPVDPKLVQRLARLFDAQGRLLRWPKKSAPRLACLWVLWSRLPAREIMTERQISDRLTDLHAFGDYAFLRRQLVDLGLVTRTPDGREYRRVESRPPAEALALLERLDR
jgi:hypothetical protein